MAIGDPFDFGKLLNTSEILGGMGIDPALLQARQTTAAEMLAQQQMAAQNMTSQLDPIKQWMATQDQQMLAQAQGASVPNVPQQNATISARAREMFLKRVGGLRQELRLNPTMDFLWCHPYNDEIIMFYMINGKEGIIHEAIDLFPSDTLVAQFRLITANG